MSEQIGHSDDKSLLTRDSKDKDLVLLRSPFHAKIIALITELEPHWFILADTGVDNDEQNIHAVSLVATTKAATDIFVFVKDGPEELPEPLDDYARVHSYYHDIEEHRFDNIAMYHIPITSLVYIPGMGTNTNPSFADIMHYEAPTIIGRLDFRWVLMSNDTPISVDEGKEFIDLNAQGVAFIYRLAELSTPKLATDNSSADERS